MEQTYRRKPLYLSIGLALAIIVGISVARSGEPTPVPQAPAFASYMDSTTTSSRSFANLDD